MSKGFAKSKLGLGERGVGIFFIKNSKISSELGFEECTTAIFFPICMYAIEFRILNYRGTYLPDITYQVHG